MLGSLFSVASDGGTGLFHIEVAGPTGPASRLELERGFVHGLANVERRPRGEEMLERLLGKLGDAATARFVPRPPGGPIVGNRVTPFHPARIVRDHVEKLEPSPLPSFIETARLRLLYTPHASCLEFDESRVVSTLASVPRRFDELAAISPPVRLARLVRFLAAVNALAVEDSAIAAAFAELGLAEGAPLDDIKRAYRQLALRVHPDANLDADPATLRDLEARFHRINTAYRRLTGE